MRGALAKGVRTFLAGMAGTLTTLAALDVFANAEYATQVFVLGLVASLLAGTVSFLQNAYGSTSATTPVGKALRTFYQLAGSGLASVVVTDLTSDAIEDLAKAVLRVGIASCLAALATLALNVAEAEA